MEKSHTWTHAPATDEEAKKSRARTFSQPRKYLRGAHHDKHSLLASPRAHLEARRHAPPPPPTASPPRPPLPLLQRLKVDYPPNISLVSPPSSLEAETKLATLRTADLTASLSTLSSAALAATQRLDAAFDGLLASTAGLGRALGELGALHSSLGAARREFVGQAEKVRADTGRLVGGYKGFEEQEGRVEGLMEKLGRARERVERMKDRRTKLMGRVAEMEREEEKRGRGRWWWSMGGMMVAAAVLLGVLGWLYVRRAGREGQKRQVGIRIGREQVKEDRWRGVLDEL